MGLQEHAADKAELEEQLPQPTAEEEGKESEGEAHVADKEAEPELAADKEQEGPSVIEKMVAELGPAPPIETLVEKARELGCLPGTPEYDELLSAVQKHCGNDVALKVEEALGGAAPAAEEKTAEAAPAGPPDGEAPAPEAEVAPEAAPQAEQEAAPEAAAEAEVAEKESEEAPAAAEEVAGGEKEEDPAAVEQIAAEEKEAAPAVAEAAEEVAEKAEEQENAVEEAAAPTAAPEEKEEAAEAQQAELAEHPSEAKAEEEATAEVDAEQTEAQKEEVVEAVADKVDEQQVADDAARAQALAAEADRLLAMRSIMLQDLVIECGEAELVDATQAALARWSDDLGNYVAQLEATAEEIRGTSEATTAEKADALATAAAELRDAAPAQAQVAVTLDSGELLSFEAPIRSRDSAVADVLAAFEALRQHADDAEETAPEAEAAVEDQPPAE